MVTKRIYEEPSDDDGCRVLVDRLWPRGVSKERAALDLWLKEIAPSPPLRTEFAHMRERFADFREAYLAELEQNPAVETLLELATTHPRVTLLYAAKDPEVNHARVLQEFMEARIKLLP
ncbi:MarR family transcriptional regulator [Arthrobacter sp. SW1]|nr:MarR family transcriptional regulator [Arthrobacter sp. SW1]